MAEGSGERANKAAGFLSMMEVLKERLPPAGYAELVAALPSRTQVLVHTPPVAMSWIAYQAFVDVIETATRVSFANRPEAMFDVGRRQMQRDMKTLYKVFVRFASPQSVLLKAAQIYGTYTKNGTMSAREAEPRVAEVKIDDVINTSPAFWEFQRGCIVGVLEQTGIKDITCQLVSGGGVGNHGTFRVRWR